LGDLYEAPFGIARDHIAQCQLVHLKSLSFELEQQVAKIAVFLNLSKVSFVIDGWGVLLNGAPDIVIHD